MVHSVHQLAINLGRNLGINSSNVLHEVNNTARVSVFVVIPGNKLDKVGVEHDTSISIKDGGAEVTLEISGDKWLITVSKESLHFTLSLALDDRADLFVGGGLGKTASQVNNRDINGGDTEGHTGKLSNKGRNDLGDGLGGTSGRGDDVARGGTSSTPVLAGRRVDNGLGGGHGVNGGHEGFLNSELVVDGLDHRGKTVGGTGGARDEVFRSIVHFLVDTHDNSQGVILGGGRVDDLLGTSVNDGLGLFLGEENTGGLADVVSTEGTPADFLRVTAARGLDLLAVKDKEVSVNLNGLLGLSVDGVVLVLVGHVVGGGGSGVDGLKVTRFVFHHDTGDETSDTSETVNTHAGGGHGHGGVVGLGTEGSSREAVGWIKVGTVAEKLQKEQMESC